MGGKHRESGDGGDWTEKDGNYGFNKEYKLEAADHWNDFSSASFKAFKLKAEPAK